jgi:methyl-accepting chemotaxis protein
MNFIENVRIRTRMMWLAGVTILSLLAVGAIYLEDDSLLADASKIANSNRNLEKVVQHVEVGIFNLRQLEEAYLLQHEEKTLQEYGDATASVLAALDDAIKQSAETSTLGAIRIIRAGVEHDREEFQKFTTIYKKISLDADGGLQARLVSAGQAMETMLGSADLAALGKELQLMRRIEMRFVEGGEARFVRDLDQEREAFNQMLAASTAPQPVKQQLSGLMDNYQKGIHEWADLKAATEKEIKDISSNFGAIAPEIVKIYAAVEKKDDEAELAVDATRKMTEILFFSVGIVILVVSVGLTFLIARSIVNPISRMTSVMSRMAKGDNNQDIPAVENRDEIGEMARAVLIFKENALQRERLEEEQRQAQARREQQMQRMEELTRTFDEQAKLVVGSVAAAADELQHTATSMTATAEESNRQAAAVAAASEEASANVQTVATASEEMSASIAEINRQVRQSAETANRANAEAERTNATVQGMADAAQKIGEVVGLISEIAEQTNLLALNATIEAARAGEAGKGFAVVASEVKNLATQTAKATDEITEQVQEMQTVTGDAVGAIQSIGNVINEIKSIVDVIATAVGEQGQATQEIASNTQQAAVGTREVSSNIVGVTEASSETGAAAQQVLTASSELSQNANQMRLVVEQFLADIKAA